MNSAIVFLVFKTVQFLFWQLYIVLLTGSRHIFFFFLLGTEGMGKVGCQAAFTPYLHRDPLVISFIYSLILLLPASQTRKRKKFRSSQSKHSNNVTVKYIIGHVWLLLSGLVLEAGLSGNAVLGSGGSSGSGGGALVRGSRQMQLTPPCVCFLCRIPAHYVYPQAFVQPSVVIPHVQPAAAAPTAASSPYIDYTGAAYAQYSAAAASAAAAAYEQYPYAASPAAT